MPSSSGVGRLVVPRRVAKDDGAAEVTLVLQHAADALTIGRLLGDDSLALEVEAHGDLLQDLLQSSTLDEPALLARARALGLPGAGALSVVVLAGVTDADRDRALIQAGLEAAQTARVPAIVGRLRPGRVALVLACRSRESEPDTVARVLGLLPGTSVVTSGAAGPVTGMAALPPAVDEAALVADVAAATAAAAAGDGARRVWRAADLGVQALLWQLRDDPRLLTYVDGQLGPVLRLDDRTRRLMLASLSAYLEAGGVVTAFATAVGVSRPAAYARLARLRAVLGRDLDEPRTRLSLHLALLALQQSAATAED